jgi:hypothetical protein
MVDFNTLIPFLVKAKLTLKEYMGLYLKYVKKNRLLKQYRVNVLQGKKRFFTNEERNKLIDLGYLVKDDTREGDFYVLGDTFLDLFVDCYVAGGEFWIKYPAFIQIKGRNAPLKAADKNSIVRMYWNAISRSRHEHNEVMKDLEYGKEHDYIKCNIKDFLNGEMWLDIREVRTGDNEDNIINHNLNDNEF